MVLDSSVGKGEEGVRIDAGLAKGRSFGATFGPNGEIVHIGKIGGPNLKL